MSDELPEVSDSDVAIVGTAARFPGARTPEALWRIFRDGVEAITHYGDEELLERGVDPAELRDPAYVRASGHLDDVEMFDAGFFGFGPKDAAITDPQHRHFLECCWEALEDAGHPPSRFEGSIGVFAGCGLNAYFIYNLLRNREVLRSTGAFLLRHTGNDRDFLPTTVSYKLDLTGPSVAVQTACSTSLVAIHLACQSLISGECDMVLAGGVTVKVPHKHGYLYAENEPLDPTGHCRAFDARGAGTVLSSGAGVVVLRRLAEALEDGDRVQAVIKGSAINNDGSRKIGYLAPSVDGQAAVVAEALAVADVPADSISYVAAHGTGTHVGDPIEISALTQAYRESTDRTGFCWIGSSKPNIGHTDNAAGVASVLEVVEALKHRQIPPSLHFERPNPNIDFERSPFRVSTELRDWPAGPGPRRAGVSSLGVGGTNAHVILEEAPPAEPSGPATRALQVLPLSARNGRALDHGAAKLAAHLRERPDLDLADAAYTLDVGREAFEHRRVLVAGSPADAAEALEAADPKRVFSARAAETPPAVDFMFPGAGAQYPGMGRELYETERVYREAIDECLEIAAPHLPCDLRALMFPDGPASDAVRAELATPTACLPAIFATEVALARLWRSWGVEPRAMLGHSMGEYTAAHFAGVMSLADALKIVCLRGVLVDGLEVRGRMLSVPLPEAEVRELVDGCELAAANGPSLCTVSGTEEEIEAFDAKLRARDVECRRLRVSGAGHSRLLDPILPAFREGLASVRLSPPERPFLSNTSGDWVKPEEAASPDYWVRHFRRTVRWSACLETLLAEGSHLLLEVGPGQTLGSLARQQAKKPVAAISSLRHPDDDVSDLRFVLTSFGRLWAHGADVRFERLREGERRSRIALPTYGWDHQAYWIEPDPPAVAAGAEAAELERSEAMDAWFFRPSWRAEPPPVRDEGPLRWLVFADDTGVGAALVARLEAQGHSVVTVREGDAFYELGPDEYAVSPEAGLEGYVSLVRALAASDRLPDRVAHLWLVTGDDPKAWDGSNFFHHCEERGFYSLLHLAQALGAEDVTRPVHLAVVSNGRERVGDEPLAHPEKATAWGPIRVIPQEFRNVTCQAVDLPKRAARGRWWRREAAPDAALHVEWLAADVHPDAADRALAYRGSERFVQELAPVRPDALPELRSRLRDGGTYLVTGGLGGLGLMLAEYLARTRRANLVLVSRTPLPPRDAWDAWIAGHGSGDPTAQRLRTLLEIERLGGSVQVEAADVSNVERMREVVARAKERFGALHGVFHAAGVIDDGPIQTKSQPEIERVFSPKVHGTLVLDAIVREERPDLFVLFSSNSAWLGPAGQVDYAGASAFLNALAEARAGDGPTYTVAVDWGVWQGVGGAVETYRRLSGAERAGPPVAHPLLDRRAPADGGREAFTSQLEVDAHWTLDEHRTSEGVALLPGTGYLEMVRGAFAELEDGPVEIRGATFLAPLAVDEDAPLEVRLELAPEGGAHAREDGVHAFEVSSRAPGSEEWQLHAQGRVGRAAAAAPPPLAVAELEARCPRVEDAGAGEGLRTLHEGQLRLGPRWRSIRRMAFGEGEAVARLALPEDFRRDLDAYALHPALLDMATGFATPLIEGYDGEVLFAPMSYGRVRVFDRLPAEIVSHVRSAGENRIGRETASFHVTLAAPDGRVLVEVEDFTLRKIAGPVRFAARRGAGGARAAGGGEGHALSEAERVFQRTYELGIRPEEGVAALDRVLAGGALPSVSVSPIPLPTLVERMRSLPAEAAGGAAHFARPELDTDYVAPRDEVERTLADIWRELLGVDEVGIHDDFFELGGHSLIAVRVFAKIKKLWDVEYPISLLFDAPNVERIAETIRADAGLDVGDAPAPRSLEPRFRCLVPLQKGEGSARPPFFLVAGMFGNVLNLRHIATHLRADQPMWAIQARGLLGDDPPHESFEEAARDYLAEVREVQPHGPYYLGGFSGGGITAFEMARQLREAGEAVGGLVLLDSIPAEMPPLSLRDRLVVQWQRLRAQGPAYLGRWLRNRIRWEIEKRQKRAEAGGPSRDLSPAEFRSGQIEAAFRRSLARYTTGVFDGPLTLIRPPRDGMVPLGGGRHLMPVSREIVDAENNWGAHTTVGVRVEEVPGDHDSMVLEPNVRVLAARLQRCLDEAMEAEPPAAGD